MCKEELVECTHCNCNENCEECINQSGCDCGDECPKKAFLEDLENRIMDSIGQSIEFHTKEAKYFDDIKIEECDCTDGYSQLLYNIACTHKNCIYSIQQFIKTYSQVGEKQEEETPNE